MPCTKRTVIAHRIHRPATRCPHGSKHNAFKTDQAKHDRCHRRADVDKTISTCHPTGLHVTAFVCREEKRCQSQSQYPPWKVRSQNRGRSISTSQGVVQRSNTPVQPRKSPRKLHTLAQGPHHLCTAQTGAAPKQALRCGRSLMPPKVAANLLLPRGAPRGTASSRQRTGPNTGFGQYECRLEEQSEG
jgi:hypothetical protein